MDQTDVVTTFPGYMLVKVSVRTSGDHAGQPFTCREQSAEHQALFTEVRKRSHCAFPCPSITSPGTVNGLQEHPPTSEMILWFTFLKKGSIAEMAGCPLEPLLISLSLVIPKF